MQIYVNFGHCRTAAWCARGLHVDTARQLKPSDVSVVRCRHHCLNGAADDTSGVTADVDSCGSLVLEARHVLSPHIESHCPHL